MRAVAILRQLCRSLKGRIHSSRLATMFAAVDALVRGRRLSLTALGRSMASRVSAKHRIKRVDRLLGNSRLHAEIPFWYEAVTSRLLRRCGRPIVLIDWTQTIGKFNALVAALAFAGRAIPLYCEVHPRSKYGNRNVQQRFLAQLEQVLPEGSQPILVADAGFKTPFFRAVVQRGWDFVIRLRGDGILKQWSRISRVKNPKVSFKRAFAMAIDRPQAMGNWFPYAGGGWGEFAIVLGARPHREPTDNDAYHERSALEPWLLATSLREHPARIVAIYAMRMQIEETFRDLKNGRLGLAFQFAGSRSCERQAVLLLIAALAMTATLLTGAAAEKLDLVRHLQANTLRKRRVLSLHHVGLLLLTDSAPIPISISHLLASRRLIARLARSWLQLCLPLTTLRSGRWR